MALHIQILFFWILISSLILKLESPCLYEMFVSMFIFTCYHNPELLLFCKLALLFLQFLESAYIFILLCSKKIKIGADLKGQRFATVISQVAQEKSLKFMQVFVFTSNKFLPQWCTLFVPFLYVLQYLVYCKLFVRISTVVVCSHIALFFIFGFLYKLLKVFVLYLIEIVCQESEVNCKSVGTQDFVIFPVPKSIARKRKFHLQ